MAAAAVTKKVTYQDIDVLFLKNKDSIANLTFSGRCATWIGKNLQTPAGIYLIAKATKESFNTLGIALEFSRFAKWERWTEKVVQIAGLSVQGLSVPLLILSLPALALSFLQWDQQSWSDIASSSAAGVSQAIFVWNLVSEGTSWIAIPPFVGLFADGLDLAREGKQLYWIEKVPEEAVAPKARSPEDRRMALKEAETLEALKVAKIAIVTLASFVLVWQITIPFVSASWAAAITVGQYRIIYSVFAFASATLAVAISYYRSTMLELAVVAPQKKG
ncbi:MAG TPA: hypothetical protein VGM34_02360 [Chlamydiales bacterium]|jgi:hypothetical protein